MKRISVFVSIFFLCIGLSACATTGGPLHIASGQGDLTAIKNALHAGADPNEHKGKMTNIVDGWSPAGWGGPPLHHAAYYCRAEAARVLIEKGADVNAKGGIGLTALHRAAVKDCVEVIKILLEKGADINARDTGFQYSPLEWAALSGSSNAVRLLIEKGADPEEAMFKLQTTNKGKLPSTMNPEAGVQLLSAVVRRDKKAGQPAGFKDMFEGGRPEARSDVDDIPSAKAKLNKNAYAIVIGIEQYRQKLPKADFAVSDAKIMVEYLTRVLGYPEENVITLLNDHASNVDLVKYFEKWLPNNVEPGASVFIYYSGHGAPNPKTGDAYLVPYDGDPSFIDETGYSLKRMYAALGKLPAKKIIVALDSCFSGAGGRSVIAKGSRPLVMNLQTATALAANMTVLSASSGEQTSSTYDEKGHGLFTYFMLKGIKDENVVKPDGSIAISDLFGYIKPQVERIARKQYNNEQSPQLIGAKKN
ncbi:MAG TPA: peptidase C14 [Nitrospiraceae bacterium]|nr:peptidase C14 [Nitrospiraceae bacterium]